MAPEVLSLFLRLGYTRSVGSVCRVVAVRQSICVKENSDITAGS
jgi:hypothetical protein